MVLNSILGKKSWKDVDTIAQLSQHIVEFKTTCKFSYYFYLKCQQIELKNVWKFKKDKQHSGPDSDEN